MILYFLLLFYACTKVHYCLRFILCNKRLISVDEVTGKCYWVLCFQQQPWEMKSWAQSEGNDAAQGAEHSLEKPSRHPAFNFLFRQSHSQQKECLGFQPMKERTDAFNIWENIRWNPCPWIITLSLFSLQFSSLIRPHSPTPWPRSLRSSLEHCSSCQLTWHI